MSRWSLSALALCSRPLPRVVLSQTPTTYAAQKARLEATVPGTADQLQPLLLTCSSQPSVPTASLREGFPHPRWGVAGSESSQMCSGVSQPRMPLAGGGGQPLQFKPLPGLLTMPTLLSLTQFAIFSGGEGGNISR